MSGFNWAPSRALKKDYRCKACNSAASKAVNNTERGRAKQKEYLERKRSKNAAPRVYVVVNPAYPQHVKIGKTDLNPALRLRTMNGSDPFLAYSYAACTEVKDSSAAERRLHAALHTRRMSGRQNEWFRVPVQLAVALVEHLGKEVAQSCPTTNSISTPSSTPPVS